MYAPSSNVCQRSSSSPASSDGGSDAVVVMFMAVVVIIAVLIVVFSTWGCEIYLRKQTYNSVLPLPQSFMLQLKVMEGKVSCNVLTVYLE